MPALKRWPGCTKSQRAPSPAILERLQKDSDEGVRGRAAWSLRYFKPQQADPLLECLKTEKAVAVLASAAESLGFMKIEAAIEPLTAAYPKADARLQKATIRAIYKIKSPKSVPLILSILATDPNGVSRTDAARLLSLVVKALSPKATKALTDALKGDSDPRVRAQAAMTLGKLNAQSAESALSLALKDANKRVQNSARAALNQLRSARDGAEPLTPPGK